MAMKLLLNQLLILSFNGIWSNKIYLIGSLVYIHLCISLFINILYISLYFSQNDCFMFMMPKNIFSPVLVRWDAFLIIVI